MAEGSLEKGFILDPEAKMKSRIDEQSELICILKLGFLFSYKVLNVKSFVTRHSKSFKTRHIHKRPREFMLVLVLSVRSLKLEIFEN